ANAHYMAIVEFFTGCTYGIWGTVTDLSGNPIDANLEIGLYEGLDLQPLRFCRTDVTLGDYHKTLLPGTYDVTVTADGYYSQSVTGVTVESEEAVEVSFVLSQLGIEDSGTGIPIADFLASPNPTSGSCQFSIPIQGVGGTIAIYDLTGRCVETSEISPEADSFLWDLQDKDGADIPNGVYITRFRTGFSDWITRVIVSR
ncbi:MAG: carboxypeptidase regulatory-like domain-containing protein, partial [Candidatus Fermentibacteria bacterium]